MKRVKAAEIFNVPAKVMEVLYLQWSRSLNNDTRRSVNMQGSLRPLLAGMVLIGMWISPACLWAQGQLYNTSITLAGTLNAGNATGSVNAYVLNLNPPITAYVTNQCYTFKANTTNTSIATLNVNGLGAKTLKKFVGAVMTDLSANDIGSGQPVLTCYDGTYMQLVGAGGGGGGGGGMSPFGQANAAAFGMANFGGL